MIKPSQIVDFQAAYEQIKQDLRGIVAAVGTPKDKEKYNLSALAATALVLHMAPVSHVSDTDKQILRPQDITKMKQWVQTEGMVYRIELQDATGIANFVVIYRNLDSSDPPIGGYFISGNKLVKLREAYYGIVETGPLVEAEVEVEGDEPPTKQLIEKLIDNMAEKDNCLSVSKREIPTQDKEAVPSYKYKVSVIAIQQDIWEEFGKRVTP